MSEDFCPVISSGDVTLSTLSHIRKYQADREFILSGPRGIRRVTPEDPIDFLNSLSFKTYYEVETSAKKILKTEVCSSGNPLHNFIVQISISIKVRDSEGFIRNYGAKGTILDPVYPALLGRLKRQISQYYPADIKLVREALERISRDVKDQLPVVSCVQIVNFEALVDCDEEFRKDAVAYQTMQRTDLYGSKLLLAMQFAKHNDPEAYLKALREDQAFQAQLNHQHQEGFENKIQRTIDLMKHAQDQGFHNLTDSIESEMAKTYLSQVSKLDPKPAAIAGKSNKDADK